MDLPPDEDPSTDDLSQHMARLGLSAAAQRTEAAHAVSLFARSSAVVDGKVGPLRRAERALLSALLDASYDKSWQTYLLGALDSVFEAHPSLTEDASNFGALASAVSFAQDRVRVTKGMSAERTNAALSLLERLASRVLAVAGPEAGAIIGIKDHLAAFRTKAINQIEQLQALYFIQNGKRNAAEIKYIRVA